MELTKGIFGVVEAHQGANRPRMKWYKIEQEKKLRWNEEEITLVLEDLIKKSDLCLVKYS